MHNKKFAVNIFGNERFRKSPGYLPYYYLLSFVVVSITDIVLLFFHSGNSGILQLTPYDIVYSLAGIYIGGLSLVFIHNASHNSFAPDSPWINRLIGEIAGHHQLYGFLGWKTAHAIHHHYPDDQERDPHPPGKLGFWQYFIAMRKMLGATLTEYYLDTWENNSKYKRMWILNNLCGFLGLWVRLLFWYLLLGPKLFIVLYLPSYLSNMYFSTQLNYYAHVPVPEKEGSFEIINLNHNFLYKFMNTIFFGLFFHKNHHLKPYLFNPAKLSKST